MFDCTPSKGRGCSIARERSPLGNVAPSVGVKYFWKGWVSKQPWEDNDLASQQTRLARTFLAEKVTVSVQRSHKNLSILKFKLCFALSGRSGPLPCSPLKTLWLSKGRCVFASDLSAWECKCIIRVKELLPLLHANAFSYLSSSEHNIEMGDYGSSSCQPAFFLLLRSVNRLSEPRYCSAQAQGPISCMALHSKIKAQ